MTKAKQDQLEELAKPGAPDLNELMADYQWCVERRASNLFERHRVNWEARYCWWPNQTVDGRKWTPKKGEREVRPWKGASDSRPHLIDTYVEEDKAKLMTVWRRNKIHVAGTESNDTEFSTRLTQLMRWLRYTQMTEAPFEAELCANWLLERGTAMMGIFWQRETRMGYDELDLESLVNEATLAGRVLNEGQLPPGADASQLQQRVLFPQWVLDPEREEQAVQAFGARYPDVAASAARKAVQDLRKAGYARFTRPYVKENRPCVLTLLPNEEVFIPEDACDLAHARSIYRRELLTEATLRERVNSHEWDAKFVEEVVETQRGNVREGLNSAAAYRLARRTSGLSYLRTSKLFEVLHAYRRLTDEQNVLGIYYTCFHAGLTGKSSRRQGTTTFAYHGLLNYEHGEYPFSLFRREIVSRVLDDARGYGEILNTAQAQVKAQWDLRVDSASIKTLPPSYCPPSEAPEEWGPGVQIETSSPDRYGFFESPAHTAASEEIEESIRMHADRRMGRPLPDGSNRVAAGAMDQDLADKWMGGWKTVDTQCLQLYQQFGPEEIYYRVVGNDQAKTVHANRSDIQGQFDVSISYNVGNMDLNNLEPVFKFFGQVLAWDISGRVDRDELIAYAFDAFDPNLAERVLKPAQASAAGEIEDERRVVSQLATGVSVDVKPGQAWELRLKTLNETITNSPKLRKLYESDEDFRERVDRRMQQLQHQVQQYTVNAESGRLGDKPAGAPVGK